MLRFLEKRFLVNVNVNVNGDRMAKARRHIKRHGDATVSRGLEVIGHLCRAHVASAPPPSWEEKGDQKKNEHERKKTKLKRKT